MPVEIRTRLTRQCLFVNLATVGNPRNRDKFGLIIDEINHAPVTHSNAPLIFVASQFFASSGPGIVGERQDLAVNPHEQCIVESV